MPESAANREKIEAGGPDRERRHHDPGRPPLRRGRVGASRRRHRRPREPRLRAARGRVPDDLVAERDQHRRPEVLPRPARLRRARALGQADDRPGRGDDRRLGPRGRLLRHRRGRRRVRGRADPHPAPPEGRLQLPVWFNVGFEEHPQCSACQPYHALVSTPHGMVPIGELVDGERVGHEVYDADGMTRIVAMKANGRKRGLRVRLRNGCFVEATADHLVKAVARAAARRRHGCGSSQLEAGMRLHLHPHRAQGRPTSGRVAVGRAAALDGGGRARPERRRVAVCRGRLAGWLQADGFVGQYEDTNQSLTIEFQAATDEEYDWVIEPPRRRASPTSTGTSASADTQDVAGAPHPTLRRGPPRRSSSPGTCSLGGSTSACPSRLWTATHRRDRAAYLRSLFQADGYVTVRRGTASETGASPSRSSASAGPRTSSCCSGRSGSTRVALASASRGPTATTSTRCDQHRLGARAASPSSSASSARASSPAAARLAEPAQVKACPALREEEIVAIEDLGVRRSSTSRPSPAST